ncbi:hypothetical protein CH373_13360 [Leptospira perolatii]|uniref:Rod shape-determining protein MreD n=1 Tax=Leptospira perolatii TaxID=2023191 RepID=A0A2M9ZKW0_9LEPT|nr:DUF6580 family putative transport protein [Leptospira perolatii]PJZ69904.1 hypothetical protein CH360_08325 [Leptospira perolatii]PJZ72688.1 hypothetical protein CH373_13360 [Leptospira perolatii]
MNSSRNIAALVLLVIAFASRFIPHVPNFTPILAISLFGGVYFTDKRVAILLPLSAMLMSDLIKGFHDLIPVVYGMFALFAYVGTRIRENLSVGTVALAGLAGALSFYLVTNFFVWLTSGMYSLDLSGLLTCYVAAIPFFKNFLIGTAVYMPILFGGFYLLEKTGVVKARQEV